MKNDDALKSTMKVEEFLMKLMHERYNEREVANLNIPYDTIPYGEALLRWKKNGKNPKDMFSTDDPTVLFFRKELTEKFGLEIITHEEAEERKKILNMYKTMKVTGIPSVTKLLN